MSIQTLSFIILTVLLGYQQVPETHKMVEQNFILCHSIYCNYDYIVAMENTAQVNCVSGTSDVFLMIHFIIYNLYCIASCNGNILG